MYTEIFKTEINEFSGPTFVGVQALLNLEMSSPEVRNLNHPFALAHGNVSFINYSDSSYYLKMIALVAIDGVAINNKFVREYEKGM